MSQCSGDSMKYLVLLNIFFIRKNLKWCKNIEYIDSYKKNEPNMEGNTEYLLTRDKIFGTIETYR